MKIKYSDTNLKTHEINLDHAINVEINGIFIKVAKGGITVHADDKININPNASNSITITTETKQQNDKR